MDVSRSSAHSDLFNRLLSRAVLLCHVYAYCPTSLFSPTPSLCSMVSHKYNMRSDARTFNLSGMGCSAGIISLDLAKVSPLLCAYRIYT